MSCLCCADLREKMDALEKAHRNEGRGFVRIGGKLNFISFYSHDCIYRNVGGEKRPTKHCYFGICNPSGCKSFKHWSQA